MASQVQFRESKTEVDYQTGEITKTEQVTSQKISAEPAYVKIYLDHITRLKDLPKCSTSILYSLVQSMTYNSLIVINASVKRMIAKEHGIGIQTISNAITRFVKDGLMVRKDTGLYMLDPNLFARGKWSDIEKLRNEFLEFSITYSPDGSYEMKATFKEDEKKLEKLDEIKLKAS